MNETRFCRRPRRKRDLSRHVTPYLSNFACSRGDVRTATPECVRDGPHVSHGHRHSALTEPLVAMHVALNQRGWPKSTADKGRMEITRIYSGICAWLSTEHWVTVVGPRRGNT